MSYGWRLLNPIILGLAWLNPVAHAQNANASQIASEIRRYESIVREPSAQRNGTAWWRLAML